MIESSPEKTKVLVMAGGTGGHVFPALAVANDLRKEHGVNVQWLGTARGIESRVVPDANIKLHCIKVEGIRGKGRLSLLLAPLKLLKALWQSAWVLRKVKPDAVIGFGGFASGPGGFMAKVLGIPLLIHEQNAIAGTTNKILRPLANRNMQAFSGALKNAEVVGNPVRDDIVALDSPARRSQSRQSDSACNLLVLGGSLGARAINELLPEALMLIDSQLRPNVWHQCGPLHADATRECYENRELSNIKVEAFIDDMASAYSWADLIICRAGALTISELTAVGLGGLLIPYPWAIDDHQAKNAEVLVAVNAAKMCRQEQITAASLANDLIELMKDKPQLLQMAENARTLARPLAAQSVASACLELTNA